MMRDPDKPSPRRLQRAGITVVVILLAMIVLIFVGRNIWHAERLDQEERTGVQERKGLN
ncbi:hypothetical protein EDF57_10872 [Novosphingobium sp. PhB55]|nr:hypothetical protein EDF57_10872 [Novosphingobium sp. PhB55]